MLQRASDERIYKGHQQSSNRRVAALYFHYLLGSNLEMYEIKSALNPGIFKSPVTGKTFIIAGDQPWMEVPPETTLDDVKWIPLYKPEKAPVDVPKQVFKVEGSKGLEYTVKQAANGSWSCECVGFGYRNTCRHITNCELITKSEREQ